MSAPVEAAVLDDLDARAGSATSLVRTVLGAHVRRLGGWVAIGDLTRLLEQAGVPAQGTRTAVARLKAKGVVLAEARQGRSGYALSAAAVAMFERGDPRIFGYRRMRDDEPWRLISFTMPESARAARHQLRRRLAGIGAGTVAAGLWICPDHLGEEVAAIVAALGLREQVTTFRVDALDLPGTPREAAAHWWDLDDLAERHRVFLQRAERLGAPDGEAADDGAADGGAADGGAADGGAADGGAADGGAAAFARFVTVLDEWRALPYLDPGLPAHMLPRDWPGLHSVEVFAEACRRDLEAGHVWVAAVCGRSAR